MWIKIPSYKSKYSSVPLTDVYLRIKKTDYDPDKHLIVYDIMEKRLVTYIEIFSSWSDRKIEGTLPMETITLYGVYNSPEEIWDIQVQPWEVYDSLDTIFPEWTVVDLHDPSEAISEAIYAYLKTQTNFLGINIAAGEDQPPM